MVTKKKPDPQIYLKTAEAIGLQASACVVVEDAIKGVQAAKAAGMKCIAVTNSFDAEKLSEADLVVASLSEVNVSVLNNLTK